MKRNEKKRELKRSQDQLRIITLVMNLHDSLRLWDHIHICHWHCVWRENRNRVDLLSCLHNVVISFSIFDHTKKYCSIRWCLVNAAPRTTLRIRILSSNKWILVFVLCEKKNKTMILLSIHPDFYCKKLINFFPFFFFTFS